MSLGSGKNRGGPRELLGFKGTLRASGEHLAAPPEMPLEVCAEGAGKVEGVSGPPGP